MDGTHVTVRDATLDDAESLVEMLNPIIAARCYTAMVDPCTVESQRAFIEGLDARSIFHVAEESTGAARRVVGCQELVPFVSESRAFDHVGVMATFVALDRHRRGIAARLFEATFEAGRRAGYEKIFTFVRADNEAGLRAYLGQGFERIGVASRHAKIDGRYVDEVMIERFL
jgi:L-amino acid N-acyltransferase YncA